MAEQLRPGDGDSRQATPVHRQGFLLTNCDGVSVPSGRETLSYSDPQCRESHPHQCPGICCSNCTNEDCLWPRGCLYWVHGKQRVLFTLVDGNVLCRKCATFRQRYGTSRSEAAQSAVHAAKALQAQAQMIQLNEHRPLSRPPRPSSLADPGWGPTRIGESAPALLSSVCVTW